ncbi:chord-domain-containing protein [Flagelloscypha sp. PMI_526]|nr:chord-domain-containing protein [Flagelloscypha sp. PMI_526]
MPRCTRKGCTKEFEEGNTDECIFHNGAPVFHEGLKSWSCCSDVYKPVLEFDQFMAIPGCTKAERHTAQVEGPSPVAPSKTQNDSRPVEPTPKPTTAPSSAKVQDGVETFSTKSLASSLPRQRPAPAEPEVEEEDDLEAIVTSGSACKHNGCKTTFESNEVNRLGDGPGTECLYHPRPCKSSQPIFHEGSKGYLCCKRRVLEFDEFLKIEGCKKGRHLFIPKKPAGKTVDEQVACRIDHYQTADQVHVSVFAKKTDKERSIVKFEAESVLLDLILPNSKRFTKTLDLFGPIDSEGSTVTFFGTKVELVLQKIDRRSWTVLEKTENLNPNIAFTFGVSGRTGTIGAKDLILDDNNQHRST